MFQNSTQSSTDLQLTMMSTIRRSTIKKVVKTANFRVKATNSHCLEAFIVKIEQSIFHPKTVKTKVFHNIMKKEREALKEIKTWKNCCVRVQDKGL